MVKQSKIDEVASLVSRLKEKGNFILTNYSGVKVKGLSELRKRLRAKNAGYKIIKNNLFKRALHDTGYQGVDEYLKGPLGVAFAGEEIGDVAKILKEYAKEDEKFKYTAGVIDRTVYNEDQVKRIADLPSRDVLIAQVMSMVNAPGTSIAFGMNQVIASIARGIQAVAEAGNKQ